MGNRDFRLSRTIKRKKKKRSHEVQSQIFYLEYENYCLYYLWHFHLKTIRRDGVIKKMKDMIRKWRDMQNC